MVGPVIVREGKVVRPSQLIASVGRTSRKASVTAMARAGTSIVQTLALVVVCCRDSPPSKSPPFEPLHHVSRYTAQEVMLSPLPSGEPDFDRLVAFAREWRSAVLAGDDRRLAKLSRHGMAVPDEGLTRQIRRSFFGARDSDRAYFRRTPRAQPFVLVIPESQQAAWEQFGGVRVCWGPSPGGHSWPMTLAEWSTVGAESRCEIVEGGEQDRWYFADVTDRIGR